MAARLEKTRTPGILKRGNRYVVPYREPITGKQRWPSFRTYEEARRFKRNQATDADRGEYVEQSRQTLHAYVSEWVERYQGGRRGFREETRDDYRRLIRQYILRFFDARLRLSELTARHIALFIAWLCDEQAQGGRVAEDKRARLAEKKGVPESHVRIVADPTPPGQRKQLEVIERPVRLSDKTVRNVLGPLRSSLSTARREGLIRHNPCDGAQLPNRPEVIEDDEENVRALGRDQLAAFLAVVRSRHRLLFRVMAATGLRVSEVIALQWRHVRLDCDQPHVRVRRRIVRGKVGPVKSRHSRRAVPLPEALVHELRAWRSSTAWPGAKDLVFPTTVGTAENKDNLTGRYLRPAMKKAGAPGAGLHTLRHTFASLHIARGTNVVQLSKLLGHHSPAFTLSTYAHLLDDGVGDALDLDAELAKSANTVQTSAAFGAARPTGPDHPPTAR